MKLAFRFLLLSFVVLATCLLAQSPVGVPGLAREKRLTRDETATQSEILDKQFKVALLVGIGDYDQALTGLSELKYPVSDIRSVAAELKLQGYTPIMLMDRGATAAQIRQRLKDLAEMIEPGKGTVIFYFSGHGYRMGDENYLATYNTTMDDLERQGLSLAEVQELLTDTGARQRIAFVDACRNNPGAKSASTGRPFDQLQDSEGLRILYSTAPGKVSYESDTLEHGVFSYFVAKGLHGEAAGPDGMVTFDDLKTWVTERMRAYGAENQKVQIPYQLGESSGDFLLVRKAPTDIAAIVDVKDKVKPPTASKDNNEKSRPAGGSSAPVLESDTTDDPPARIARLSLMDGTVSLRPAGVEEWTPAEINRPITSGDHLWVDEIGHAELQVGNGVLRLSESTGFSFLNLDDRTMQIKLTQGKLSVRLKRFDEGETVEVDTPNTAITLITPGDYSFQVSEKGDNTVVVVKNGQAEGVAGKDSYKIEASQSITVAGLDSPTWRATPVPDGGQIDRTYKARDRGLEKSISSSYVPENVVGAEELDQNGTWRPVRGYGMGWMPNVRAGWEPYRDGHWAWISPWGWTWVDDASWGFAPFHYGRWVQVDEGWAWLPGGGGVRATYSPAMVAWAQAPGVGQGVGWFPLGPGEAYVPGYRTSARYANRLNVTNVNITTVNAGPPQYSYRSHTTIVSRDAFVGARRVSAQSMLRVSPSELSQYRVATVSGVAPQMTSLMASPGSRSLAAQPHSPSAGRTVVTRSAPPNPRIPFIQQEPLLRAAQGRPIPGSELQRGQRMGERSDPKIAQNGTSATQLPMNRSANPKEEARILKNQREQAKRDSKAQQEAQKQAQKMASVNAKQTQKAAAERQKQEQTAAKIALKSAEQKKKNDQIAAKRTQKSAQEQQKRSQLESKAASKANQNRQRGSNSPSRPVRTTQQTGTAPQPRKQQPTPRANSQTPSQPRTIAKPAATSKPTETATTPKKKVPEVKQ